LVVLLASGGRSVYKDALSSCCPPCGLFSSHVTMLSDGSRLLRSQIVLCACAFERDPAHQNTRLSGLCKVTYPWLSKLLVTGHRGNVVMVDALATHKDLQHTPWSRPLVLGDILSCCLEVAADSSEGRWCLRQAASHPHIVNCQFMNSVQPNWYEPTSSAATEQNTLARPTPDSAAWEARSTASRPSQRCLAALQGLLHAVPDL
jgi:hypothetical protein